jgi:hypothetical protein
MSKALQAWTAASSIKVKRYKAKAWVKCHINTIYASSRGDSSVSPVLQQAGKWLSKSNCSNIDVRQYTVRPGVKMSHCHYVDPSTPEQVAK